VLFGAKTGISKNLGQMLKAKCKTFTKLKKSYKMDSQMERFFARKQETFQKLEFKRQSTVLTLIKLILKGLYESVRTIRVSKNGCQQLQADCCFISVVCDIVFPNDESGVIEGLLSEILTSSISRCTSFSSIDETVLESMIAFKLQKAGEIK